MHVFVEDRKHHEIAEFIRVLLLQKLQDPIAYLPHVVQSVSARREWKVPASIMGHGRRIIKGIDISADRPLLGNMAEDPFLLKPRDVSDFPEQWVNDTQTWTKKLLIGK